MGRPYAIELDRLKETVEFACGANVNPLASLLSELVSHNLIFVGSGGSFTAATFAAALHEHHTGRLAKAVTPLEAAGRPDTTNTAAVLISARGSNPDIIRAFHSLCFKEPVAAICATEQSNLLRLINDSGIGVGYGFTVPGGKDGFLATNSLLATLILLSRSYEAALSLPTTDLKAIGTGPFAGQHHWLETNDVHQLSKSDTIIVLSGGWGWPAAIDFESKCSESGLTNVLLSDFRNFAHGRHNWLRNRAETTAILSIEDRANTQLASSVLQLVPDHVQKIRLSSERAGAGAGIELVSHVLHLVGSLGAASGVDPGRPSVAKFGRELYRRGFRVPKARTSRQTWVARKADAIGLMPHEDDSFLHDALDQFLERLKQTSIKAVVADYDGTLCASSERFVGLSKSIARTLDDLLRQGLVLGVATGRGGSVQRDLARVISEEHWDKVLLGLYNGAKVLPLNQDCDEETSELLSPMVDIREALKPILNRHSLEISYGTYQVSLRQTTPIDLESLRRSITELLYDVDPTLRVRRSAHSVDVFCTSNSKGMVPRALGCIAGVDDSTILRIGDLGDWGGNDFDLLNDGLSLSVDRVSSRLGSCWNLGPPGSKGVNTTMKYLHALKPSGNAFGIDVDLIERRG